MKTSRCNNPAGTPREVCSSSSGNKGDLHRVGKAVQPLQRIKNYSNSRVHGHGRTWSGHTLISLVLQIRVGIKDAGPKGWQDDLSEIPAAKLEEWTSSYLGVGMAISSGTLFYQWVGTTIRCMKWITPAVEDHMDEILFLNGYGGTEEVCQNCF